MQTPSEGQNPNRSINSLTTKPPKGQATLFMGNSYNIIQNMYNKHQISGIFENPTPKAADQLAIDKARLNLEQPNVNLASCRRGEQSQRLTPLGYLSLLHQPSGCRFLPYIHDDTNRPHIERSVISFVEQDLGGEVCRGSDHRTTERFLFDYPSKAKVAQFDLSEKINSAKWKLPFPCNKIEDERKALTCGKPHSDASDDSRTFSGFKSQ